ncbi:hypothetical protein MtrunA17_Chr5g0422181 [Medicago truncatula]|uniref:Uncharacterized protein n=1 Tax=Medicago truncatula TaxID=3880 RepID=A0A396HTH4_MEDTR|nr:hypothetical protein MtrunA17_Chr5g0422181 [Medicago truncatula]
MNFGQIWWEIGGNLAVLDLGKHRPNMQFNICSCLVLAKLCRCHGRVGLIHIFHVPSERPSHPAWERGGRLAVRDLGRHRPNMQFNVCSCLVLAKHCLGHGKAKFLPLSHAAHVRWGG